MRRLLFCVALLVAVFPPHRLAAQDSQVIRVQVNETKPLIGIPGATAAYTINSQYADASISVPAGSVLITGKSPGTTTLVVVTSVGVQTFPVEVPQPPPTYPKGFTPPEAPVQQGGSYEVRYSSEGDLLQNTLDLSDRRGDHIASLHMVTVDPLGQQSSYSRVIVPLFSYELGNRQWDAVLGDDRVQSSPLTLSGISLRGFHFKDDRFSFDGGVTTFANFQNVFLSTDGQPVVGFGYKLVKQGSDANSGLTANLFYIPKKSKLDPLGRTGAVGTLHWKGQASKNLSLEAEVGVSRAVGFNGSADYARDNQQFNAHVEYRPANFTSIGFGALRGNDAQVNWSRKWLPRLSTTTRFNGQRTDPRVQRQSVFNLDHTLTYLISHHWSTYSGFSAGRFAGALSGSGAITSWQIPGGLAFSARTFGAGFEYRRTRNSFNDAGGNSYHANSRVNFGNFTLSAYGDRQEQTPTLGLVFASLPGLEPLLTRLGLGAASLSDISDLLRQNTILAGLGIDAFAVNLSPLRTQAGASFGWAVPGRSRQRFDYNFFYNDNHDVLFSSRSLIHSASYSRQLGSDTMIFAAYSRFHLTSGGAGTPDTYAVSAALRQTLHGLPSLLFPGRRGTIRGHVFLDERGAGVYSPGATPVRGVEVILNGAQKTLTDTFGYYEFRGITTGRHRLEIAYQPGRPYYYTTSSIVETDINQNADFGITYSHAEIFGSVTNDAGSALANVGLEISGSDKYSNRTQTDSSGKFVFPNLPEGSYNLTLTPESLPPGYRLDRLQAKQARTAPENPAKADFVVQAIRSLSGRVVRLVASKEVPVAQLRVVIPELGREAPTDADGSYVFRDLPSGDLTVVVSFQGREFKRAVTLPAEPGSLRQVDFTVETSGKPRE